jgi:hypothetical protein
LKKVEYLLRRLFHAVGVTDQALNSRDYIAGLSSYDLSTTR